GTAFPGDVETAHVRVVLLAAIDCKRRSGPSDGAIEPEVDRPARYIRRMADTASTDALTVALQAWSQGNQQAAVDAIRSHADAGERPAILLISWFLSQMGQPFWNDGLVYARRAAELGVPLAMSYFWGNL